MHNKLSTSTVRMSVSARADVSTGFSFGMIVSSPSVGVPKTIQ